MPEPDAPRSRSAADASKRPCAPARLRLPADDRRAQILAAAFEIFAEQGFHATRTRELAERAGVSEALVFRHFPTKEALIGEIIERVGFAEQIEFMEERFSDMPPREALVALATHVLTSLCEGPDMFRVVFYGVLEAPELARDFYGRFLSRLLALETRLFARAFAERRTPPPAAPGVVARAFHGSLLFYNLAAAVVRVEPLPDDPAALAEALVEIHLPRETP